MPEYTVAMMEALIRSEFDEETQVRITSAQVLAALNAGCGDVAAKTFCIEKETYVTLREGERIYPFTGIRINSVGIISGLPILDKHILRTIPGVPLVAGAATAVSETPVTKVGTLTVPGVPSVSVFTAVA